MHRKGITGRTYRTPICARVMIVMAASQARGGKRIHTASRRTLWLQLTSARRLDPVVLDPIRSVHLPQAARTRSGIGVFSISATRKYDQKPSGEIAPMKY